MRLSGSSVASSKKLPLWLRWWGLLIGVVTLFWLPIEDTTLTLLPQAPLRPADALSRARMRIWTKFVDEQLHPEFFTDGMAGHDQSERVAGRIGIAHGRGRSAICSLSDWQI